MPFSVPLRVLAMLCLSALLLVAPKNATEVTLARDLVSLPVVHPPALLTPEQLRLVDHLHVVWQVPLELAHRIVTATYKEAQSIGATPTLLLAMMAKESAFHPAVSNAYGAVGLMQVVPRFHPEQLSTGESLENPETNIRVGAEVFREYLDANDGALEPTMKKYSGHTGRYFQSVKAYQKEFERARTSASC